MFEQLNSNVVQAVSRIKSLGYSAFIAGATVRDLVMNETPAAYVIITDAEPARIKVLFKRTIENRDRKKAITVIENKIVFDVYCYENKTNGIENSDDILKKVLTNFDFTMNALLYNK